MDKNLTAFMSDGSDEIWQHCNTRIERQGQGVRHNVIQP